MVDRPAAVGERHELEVVIVPGDPQAGRLGFFRALAQLFADPAPEIDGRATLPGREVGRNHQRRTDRLGNIDEALRLAEKAGERHVETETGKAGVIELAAKVLGTGLIGRQPWLDGVITHLLQNRELRRQRRKIA